MINDINYYNKLNIQKQINKKLQNKPFYATTENSVSVITDYDTFPYPRYFRGHWNSSIPIVAEREAGWRPRFDSCYEIGKSNIQDINKNILNEYPDHCFQSACSTVYPCYPQYIKKYSDKDSLDLILNNVCTIQYR